MRLLPGTMLSGRTVIGAGSVIGPDTQLVDTIVGERRGRAPDRRPRLGDRRRRHRRPVRVAAARHPPRRRRARRHVRRDEELRDRRGRQGAAPRLRRRRRDRRPAPTSAPAPSPPTTTASEKHRTKVGADARIGSNTVLVAPVEVGEGAYTGAGCGRQPRRARRARSRKGVPARIEEGWVANARGLTAGERTTGGGGRELMELVSKKKLMLFAGPGNHELSEEIAESLEGAARRREAQHLRERRALLPLRREHPRRRRVRRPEPLRADQRPHHGAAAHDRRRQARVGAGASPRCARSTGTPARTGRPRVASRSPPGCSPTCSPSRAPTAS